MGRKRKQPLDVRETHPQNNDLEIAWPDLMRGSGARREATFAVGSAPWLLRLRCGPPCSIAPVPTFWYPIDPMTISRCGAA
jgi:hypothetical protein